MLKRCLPWAAVLALGFAVLTRPGFAETASGSKMPSRCSSPDKACMQKIWKAWATLDPANVAPYYAEGPGTFYDVAPLKYGSWAEYEEGVKNVLANYRSASLTVNDDAVVHPHGDTAWGTATIKEDPILKDGKHEMGTFRWTVIWEKRNGKWLVVHDHTSEPLQ